MAAGCCPTSAPAIVMVPLSYGLGGWVDEIRIICLPDDLQLWCSEWSSHRASALHVSESCVRHHVRQISFFIDFQTVGMPDGAEALNL